MKKAANILIERIIDGTIEMLEIEYKDDEQAQLDHLYDVMSDEHNNVMRDYFEFDFDEMEHRVKWHIADKFKDESLINELIEDEIAKKEEELDERLSSEE